MNGIRLSRVKSLAGRLKGDPRSVFYGDVTVAIEPEHAANAIGHQSAPVDVAETAIAETEPNEVVAAEKVAAYNSMGTAERAERTLLPPLACWNAMVIINPMLGKVLAKALDYMLLKTLNDYPYEGKAIQGVKQYADGQFTGVTVVTIDSDAIGKYIAEGDSVAAAHRYIALPFFRFTVAASTLNAAPGAQVTVDIAGSNAEGAVINTAITPRYQYTFQRLNNTEAVVGVYIPTTVVSTRTLPFLPIAGDQGVKEGVVSGAKSITITFTGVAESDQITVVVPGYSTAELKEISTMYNLPSGLIR